MATGDTPASEWDVDPLTAERDWRPNDYLVAPEGLTGATADAVAPIWPEETPASLFARFDAVAMAEPRSERIAYRPEEMMASYVVRSAFFGFPDYVSVRAVAVEGGASLAVWSRARYGISDLGVNEARVIAWIAALRD